MINGYVYLLQDNLCFESKFRDRKGDFQQAENENFWYRRRLERLNKSTSGKRTFDEVE